MNWKLFFMSQNIVNYALRKCGKRWEINQSSDDTSLITQSTGIQAENTSSMWLTLSSQIP